MIIFLYTAPEKPQNISQRIEIEDIFDYNVTATLSWLLPCNTNGELDHFMLVISGAPTYTTNEINTEIQENITVGRNDPIENITYEYSVSNIRGSYNYSVLILAVLNNGMEGEYEEIVFTSPEGCKLHQTNNVSHVLEKHYHQFIYFRSWSADNN